MLIKIIRAQSFTLSARHPKIGRVGEVTGTLAMSAVAKSSVSEVVSVSGQISGRVADAVDNLPFCGVVYYLVPERNFGVIVTADGLEIYFLRSSVMENSFDLLEAGARVHFDLTSSILGLQARHVRRENLQALCH